MLWFILCVAIVNLAAGFGLAVMLAGARPHEETGSAPSESVAPSDFDQLLSAAVSQDQEEEPDPSSVDAEQTPQAENETPLGSSADSESTPPSNDSIMADLDAAVSAALGDVSLPDDDEAEPSPEENKASEEEEDAEGPGENALSAFQTQLGSFCDELVALDDQLREKPPEESSELKTRLDSLAASSHKQDEACKEAERSLRDMITAETIDAKQGEAVIAAIQGERQEAAETLEAFENVAPDGDASSQCEMVLDRTASLLNANHGLRDSVSDAIADTDSGDEANGDDVDPLTGLPNRVGLDKKLAEHWKKDPHRARPLSFVLIDLDEFAKINQGHGPTVGDRVLRAMAQLLENELPPACCAARFAGQQFALLEIDRNLKQSVADAERLRQTVEMVRFEHGTDSVDVKVSCGVVEAKGVDTHKSLYDRAHESLQEAKRYGRNRCFMHEGEFPTPVVPPNLTVSEKHVTL